MSTAARASDVIGNPPLVVDHVCLVAGNIEQFIDRLAAQDRPPRGAEYDRPHLLASGQRPVVRRDDVFIEASPAKSGKVGGDLRIGNAGGEELLAGGDPVLFG